MKIYEVKVITDDILNAFKSLIPQLSLNNRIPDKKNLEKIINADNTKIFVAEDIKILGTLTLVFNKIPSGNKVWIEDVVVDKAARGMKIGQKLIEFAIDYASKKGINKIDLTSRPERIAANNLYLKLGFVKRDTNVYRLTLKK